jgi:outer membrane protein TolC
MHSLALLLAFWPAAAFAAPLSLDEAVTRATSTSHEAAIARAREDDARAQAALARAPLFPQVSASATYQHWNSQVEFPNPFDPTAGNLILQKQESIGINVTGSQVLFAPAAFARSDAANAQADAARASVDGATGDAALRAAQLWIGAKQAQEVLDAALSAQQDAEAHAAVADKMLASDATTPLAVARARLAVTDSKRRVIDAQKAYDDALGQLSVATQAEGLELGALVVPAEPTRDEAALIELATANRAELRAARAQVDAADAGRWTVAGDWAPTIAANAAWRGTNNPGITGEPTAWYVGASVSLPILDGGTRFADAKRTSAGREQAGEMLARGEELTREDVKSALRSERSAYEALAVAQEQERIADEARGQIEKAFGVGGASALDVEDARQAVLDARVGRIRAEGQAVLAGWQIRRLTGEI